MLYYNDIAYANQIDFLNHFDYVDLHNLCQTETSQDICDDDVILKSLLLNNLGLKFDLKIAKPLQDLYNSITRLVNENYPEDIDDYSFRFPRWINIPQFKDDMKRRIYINLMYIIQMDIYKYMIKNIMVKIMSYHPKHFKLIN